MLAVMKQQSDEAGAGAMPDNAFGDYIRERREAKGLTVEELAKRSGIADKSRMSGIETGRLPPPRRSRDKLILMAQALGEDPRTLFRLAAARQPDPTPGRPPFREYILKDPDLTRAQQLALIGVYETLKRGGSLESLFKPGKS